MSSAGYQALKALHASTTPFAPIIPTSFLPTLATVLLTTTFGLGFYFTTLPKSAAAPIHEAGVALLASILAGFGTVALFCSAGLYV